MKILLLIAGSRSGSDFFHSLLDGHSQILQFPGYLNINKNFYNIFNLNNPKEISQEFIVQYPHFFDSKINFIERHNQLGKNKKKFFKINKKKFIKVFLNIMKKKNYSKFEILFGLHAAYEISKGKKINNKKIIFINTHIVDYTKKFVDFMNFKDLEIIYTIRDPLSALSSSIKNWLKYKEGKYFLYESLYFHFDLIFKGFEQLLSIKKKLFVIQLEKLHKKNEKIMRSFCKLYGLKYETCLKKSTYHGLQWWGDKISGKYINGVNKNFKIKYEKNLFFDRDIIFLEHLAKHIINYYGYTFSTDSRKNYYFNILPMKCELMVWKNILKNKMFLHLITIPYFYIKRLMFINTFFIRKVKFPHSIGVK